ncbi:MAG: hypothetical protein MHMPM18_002684 [Marteilia pararefringens]
MSRRHNFTVDEKIKLIQIVKKVGLVKDCHSKVLNVKMRLNGSKWLSIAKLVQESNTDCESDSQFQTKSLRICWKNIKARAKNHILLELKDLIRNNIDIEKIDSNEFREYCCAKFSTNKNKEISNILISNIPEILRKIFIDFVAEKGANATLKDIQQTNIQNGRYLESYNYNREYIDRCQGSHQNFSGMMSRNEFMVQKTNFENYGAYHYLSNEENNQRNHTSIYSHPKLIDPVTLDYQATLRSIGMNHYEKSHPDLHEARSNDATLNNFNSYMIEPQFKQTIRSNLEIDTRTDQYSNHNNQELNQSLINHSTPLKDPASNAQFDGSVVTNIEEKYKLNYSSPALAYYSMKMPKLENYISHIDPQ